MLGEPELIQIRDFFLKKVEKTQLKIKDAQNVKIVDYKIRSMIEQLRDHLNDYDPSPTSNSI